LELTRSVETSTPSLASFDNESFSSQSLSPLFLPLIPDKVSPVYYEEEDYDDADPSLLDNYVLIDLEYEPAILLDTAD